MDRTFLLIKPEASNHEDDIVYTIQQAGFKVINRRRVRLTREQATEFWTIYQNDEAFSELIDKMTSGPVVALALLRYSAIAGLQELVGPTDPREAKKDKPESLRAKYGIDELSNGLHASDSFEAAAREIMFFFPDMPVEVYPSMEKTKALLEKALYPTLTQGLTQLCKEKPANPTAWLGHWLLEHNPNKPKVEEPDS
ncbi:NME NM23 member 5 [Rhizophlyctis rosea]|nr:NME NM23 member 5 [Rhizophlyctis rosea]